VVDDWKVVSSKWLFEHPFIRFRVDRIRRASTGEEMDYHVLVPPVETVATVAVTDSGEVLLTRQYRHPLGRVIYDLPAGRIEPGEDPAVAAEREFTEETGCRAARWEKLGYYMPFPGGLLAGTYLYLARGLEENPSGQHLDPHEHLEVFRKPFTDVLRGVLDGEYVDGALEMGILLAAFRLGVAVVGDPWADAADEER